MKMFSRKDDVDGNRSRWKCFLERFILHLRAHLCRAIENQFREKPSPPSPKIGNGSPWNY